MKYILICKFLHLTHDINLHAHRQIPLNQPLPYIEGLLFMDFDNVALTSQRPCQHNITSLIAAKHLVATFHNKRREKEDAIAIFYGKKKQTSFILLIKLFG